MIRTARLLLRPARMSDLVDLHAMMSDPAVMRFWSTEPHRDRVETERFLAVMVGEAHRGLDFMLEMDGRVIGKAGAWSPPEIGFLLSRDHWGRGLMEEALRAIIPICSRSLTCRSSRQMWTLATRPRCAFSRGLAFR